jgi:hypothetical protein
MPLFLAALLLLVERAHAAPTELFNSKNMALPGCQSTCGDVDIPYPFGVSDEGFVITCNGSMPFLDSKDYHQYRVLNLSVMPNVAVVELPISYQCFNASGDYTDDWKTMTVAFNKKGVHRFTDTRNELVIIGCNTNTYIRSNATGGIPNIFIGCISYCNSAESTVNDRCAGIAAAAWTSHRASPTTVSRSTVTVTKISTTIL